jgi:DNA-directed RNA polymerase specialized sigma24 family protein
VQEVAMKVLMACDSYVPGTNFPAWVHRIMVNQFITNVRRQREHSDLDQMPELGYVPPRRTRPTFVSSTSLSSAYRRINGRHFA